MYNNLIVDYCVVVDYIVCNKYYDV